jgi:hypothetical protein
MEMASMRLQIEGIEAIQVGLDGGGTGRPGANDESLRVGAALYRRGCSLHEGAAKALRSQPGQGASRTACDSCRRTGTRGDA